MENRCANQHNFEQLWQIAHVRQTFNRCVMLLTTNFKVTWHVDVSVAILYVMRYDVFAHTNHLAGYVKNMSALADVRLALA